MERDMKVYSIKSLFSWKFIPLQSLPLYMKFHSIAIFTTLQEKQFHCNLHHLIRSSISLQSLPLYIIWWKAAWGGQCWAAQFWPSLLNCCQANPICQKGKGTCQNGNQTFLLFLKQFKAEGSTKSLQQYDQICQQKNRLPKKQSDLPKRQLGVDFPSFQVCQQGSQISLA